MGVIARCLLLVFCVACTTAQANEENTPPSKSLRIAMLHIELKYAELEHNAKLIERGIELAAKHNVDWVMTPELAFTGYRFDLKLGTQWIETGPDRYVQLVQQLAKQHRLTIFLSHLEGVKEENEETLSYFNTLFVIDQDGEIIGRHRKVNTIPVAESWSTAGETVSPVSVDGINVGLLICADAWPPEHAQSLKDQGADLLLSSASWAPGEYGPGDTWEKRSLQTGLPVFVNNRTGIEREFDLRASQSVISLGGDRIFSHSSDNSRLILIDWNQTEKRLINTTQIPIL